MMEPPPFMRPCAIVLVAAVTAFISGCAVQPAALFQSSQSTQVKVSGRAMGGEVPIIGATITLYDSTETAHNSFSNGSYVGTAQSLGTATTDSLGSFGTADSAWSFSSAPTCVPDSLVYMTAVGGTAKGQSNTNPNIVNAAVLGIASDSACDLYQSQTLGSTTALASTNTVINEVTSVATAYAFSSFISLSGTNNDVVNITAPANNSKFLSSGSPTNDVSSGTVSTASGLQHAFYNYVNLVNPLTAQANATPPLNTQAYAPQGVVNTIANILQACTDTAPGAIDTPNASGDVCAMLYYYTPSQGNTPGSGAASSTLGAVLNMARNPYVSSANVTSLYDLAPPTGAPPYTPYLPANSKGSPNPNTDWTLAIGYPAPANPVGGIGFPFTLALDADDNVYVTSPENDPWLPNTGNSGHSFTTSSQSACLFGWNSYGEFLPTITPFPSEGDTDEAPQGSDNGSPGDGGTSTSSNWFCSGAQASTGVGSFTGEAYMLTSLAADNAGNLWIGNYGSPGGTTPASQDIIEINVNPTVSSPAVGNYENYFTEAGVQAPGIAADKFNNVWYNELTNSSDPNLFAESDATSNLGIGSNPSSSPATLPYPGRGMAFDSSGNLFIATYGPGGTPNNQELGYQVYALPVSGSQTSNPSNYEPGSAVSTAIMGATADGDTGNGPYGVAVDGSGNFWVTAGGTNACGNVSGHNTNSCSAFQNLSGTDEVGVAKCTPSGGPPFTTVTCSTISALSSASPNGSSTTPVESPKFLEADGNNVIWIMDSFTVGVKAWASTLATPALISEPTGFAPCIYESGGCTVPDAKSSPKGIAVDSTGSVWYTTPDTASTDTNANFLIQIIGTGASTWPLLAVQQPGTMPQ